MATVSKIGRGSRYCKMAMSVCQCESNKKRKTADNAAGISIIKWLACTGLADITWEFLPQVSTPGKLRSKKLPETLTWAQIPGK